MWIQHDSRWFNMIQPLPDISCTCFASCVAPGIQRTFALLQASLPAFRRLGKQFRPLRDPFPSGFLCFFIGVEVTFLQFIQFQPWDKRRSTRRQHSKKISKPCFSAQTHVQSAKSDRSPAACRYIMDDQSGSFVQSQQWPWRPWSKPLYDDLIENES